MAAEDDARQLIEDWDEGIRRWSTLAAVAGLLDHSGAFMSQVRDHEEGPRLLILLRALYAAGLPVPGDLVRGALCPLGVDHGLVLLNNREFQKLPADPFLEEVAARLEALAQAGPTGNGTWKSRLPRVLKLDEERFQDRRLAKERAEELIREVLTRLEATGERPKKALADLAGALGVLAAIHRLGGHRDAALACLLSGLPLARLAGDPMALGRWYRKALYLLVDFKRYDLASEFAHEALKHFVFAGSAADQARVLVDIGFVQSHAGLARETIATLERALELLPKSDHTSRFGAHQILAKQRLKLGDQGGARNEFDAAIPLAGNDSLALAFLHWRRAKLATETGDKAAAIESFKAALPLFVQQVRGAKLFDGQLFTVFEGSDRDWPQEGAAPLRYALSADRRCSLSQSAGRPIRR